MAVSFGLLVTACGDSVEDRATTAYQDCAAEFGFEANMIGIVRGPDGAYAVSASNLPEPAASECLRRVNEILRDE